jgi:hypothetical protein
VSRPYQRQEERDFDDWFYAQPKASQDKFRANGVLPYCEQRSDDQVFEIKPNHPAWATQPEEGGRVETERFICESELRHRMGELFRILDRFADGRMRLHLLFIRTMLGEDTGTNVTRLCKQYGMTKQAAAYRARMMRRALGSLAIGRSVWKLGKATRSCLVRRKKPGPRGGVHPGKESPKRGGASSVDRKSVV